MTVWMLTVKLGLQHRVLALMVDMERESVSGVHVTPAYAEAANGYVLVRLPLEGDVDEDGPQEALIPADAFKLALSTLWARQTMTVSIDVKAATFHTPVGDWVVEVLRAQFPSQSAERVLVPYRPNDGSQSFSVTLATKYLRAIVDIAEALEGPRIRLQIDTPLKAMRVDYGDTGIVGAVMPMNYLDRKEDGT